jgi:4-alpha-glucanotransferase
VNPSSPTPEPPRPPPPATPGSPLSSVAELAEWLGIVGSYRDVFGTVHQASDESLLAVAGVLVGHVGASVAEVAALVDQRRREQQRRMVPEVVVVWLSGTTPTKSDQVTVEIVVPSGTSRVGVAVTLDRHGPAGGEVRTLTVDPVSVGSPLDGDEPRWLCVVDLAGLDLPVGRHRMGVTAEPPADQRTSGQRTSGQRTSGQRTSGQWTSGQWTSGQRTSALTNDATIVVAPTRLPRFADSDRLWGVFAPVWSSWSRQRPEVHLGQLDALGEWTWALGARLVGTLPMLSAFLDQPLDPSPYSPVSRQWWNEALVDLDACAGIEDCAAAQALRAQAVPGDPAAPYDAAGQWLRTRAVLAALAEHASGDPALRVQVDNFVAAHPDVVQYARFRATVERTGTGWHAWPEGPDTSSNRSLDAHPDDADVRMWIHAQWEIRRQLASLSARMAGRGQRLYLDLALGAHGDGYDAWNNQSLFGWGAAVGAPPDEFFTGGQNWGFPPVMPAESRSTGHEYVADCLRTHVEVCSILRLDHVMGFQRLFWIPDGMTAADGVYVTQPMDELLAVLSVEAWRAGAVVIGENLGTVDPGVEQAMDRHGLYGMYVGQFEVPTSTNAGMQLPGSGVLASVNTHDTPSFAGWLAADDARRRRDMGLLDASGVDAQREVRSAQVARLHTELVRRGALGPEVGDPVDELTLLAGLLEVLGRTDAPAVLVSVDDLVGAIEPQNVPGTPANRPNWVLRLPIALEELAADAAVTAVLDRLNVARGAGTHGDNGTGVPLP